MPRDVIEVVARFGDTLLDVTRVRPGERYTIGTAPRVRLAVPGIGCFAVVERGAVHVPPAMTVDLVTPATTTLRLGALALTLTRDPHACTIVPAPRFGRRMPGFAIASLLAHLAIWFVAVSTAPIERAPVQRVEPRLVQLAAARIPAAVLEPPPPLPPPLKAAPAPPPRRPPPRKRTRGVDVAATFDVDAAAIARQFAASTSPSDGASRPGSGEGRRFDPAYESVPSGPYQTATYRVRQCATDDPRCQLAGPTTVKFVRTFLLDRMAEIAACHARHGGELGTLVIEFTIRGDGSVARASGDGEAGACIAAIVETITFRAQWPRDDTAAYDTHVRWPLTFR